MNDLAEEADMPADIKKQKNEIPLKNLSEKIFSNNGFDFYTIDLKLFPVNKLHAILNECDAVEKACWVAQEDFFEYASTRDILTYVIYDDRIIAFQIASYWILDNYFIFDLDETMVLKKYRGNNLARTMSVLNCRFCYLRIIKIRDIRNIVFMGLTPNMNLITLLDRLRFVYSYLDNSFKPSTSLLRIHDTYLKRKGVSLVDDDYPFFLKNVFPGSLEKPVAERNIPDRIRKILPPELDFNHRGDAFLFFASFNKRYIWPVIFILMLIGMGPRAIFNRKLGIVSRRKYDTAGRNFRLHQNTLVCD